MSTAVIENLREESSPAPRHVTANATYLIQDDFAVENLRLVDLPVGEPGPGEALIRVRAASLNFRDFDILRGQYPAGKFAAPFIPVSDVAGEVVAVGPGVTEVRAGDRVLPSFWQGWENGGQPPAHAATLGGPLPGLLRQQAVLPAASLVPLPDYLSFEEGATLPIAAVTAWNALIVHGQLRPGETVLVQGTGGVSIFALQLAKLAGARVIATSSSDEKLQRARELGADAVINYRKKPQWSRDVLQLTGGRGIDHVVEVGGVNTLSESLESIAVGGNIYVIGYLGGVGGGLNPLSILRKKARVQGVLVGSRQSFLDLNRALALHRVRPVVDRIFGWHEVQDAFRHMEAGRHFGKIAIRVD